VCGFAVTPSKPKLANTSVETVSNDSTQNNYLQPAEDSKLIINTGGVDSLDLNKLAYAVAMAETANCTKGIGPKTNNCFGIKNGNTAPCEKIGYNNMCIYEKPEDGYEAFKKIWSVWYKAFPTLNDAHRWTGSDNPAGWLITVTKYYNE